jgi:UDP-glucose 4-epimerase
MMRPRIAVLGAGGLIGAAIAARLAPHARVLRIGRSPGMDVVCDLATPDESLLRAIDAMDAVIHCAGVTDEEFAADASAAWRRGIDATRRLATYLSLAGVGRVVYVSTAHVYGPLVGPIGEHDAPDPRSDYAIAHFAAEQILRRTGIPGGVVRPCAVFGDPTDLRRFTRWSLTPFAFPRSAVERGEIVLASPGTQRRNFVSVEGVAARVADLLDGPDSWRVVNPVGASTLSIREWAELVAARAEALTGRPCRVAVPVDAGGRGTAPFTYLSACADADDAARLPAWTDSFLNRLLDGRTHAPEQSRTTA